MTILDRIFDLINQANMSLRQFEIEADIPTGYLSKTNQKTKTINSDRLVHIYMKLSKILGKKINAEWFLTGKGQRFLGGYQIEDKTMVVNESTKQDDFELRMLVGLDNQKVIQKIKDIVATNEPQ